MPKRKIYNFKKANWLGLNQALENTPWDQVLGNREPEHAWQNFKSILFYVVDKHIPTITIKSTFSSPWFDSKCYEAYREKKRAHRLRSGNGTIDNEIKFSNLRRSFTNICNQKMRENMYNDDDPDLITKKFWSHVKSKNLSHRIPDCMHRDKTYRNKPLDKAELFNNYFYEQFSDASQYDIDIGWANDVTLIDIDFTIPKIQKLLSNINPNKACGPDGIH